jgi:CheY-like chemotaxis protein
MSRRILLADDSVTIQKVIELTFMDDDYEVRAVGNGDEALAMLTALTVDFVIADVHMPGASGYEVCRRSKQLRPEVPVLLLVGTFEPFDEAQARECGANSFLKKPFDSQELLGRVHDLLGPATPETPETPATPETPEITAGMTAAAATGGPEPEAGAAAPAPAAAALPAGAASPAAAAPAAAAPAAAAPGGTAPGTAAQPGASGAGEAAAASPTAAGAQPAAAEAPAAAAPGTTAAAGQGIRLTGGIEAAASWQEFELEAEPEFIPDPWPDQPHVPSPAATMVPAAVQHFEQPFALGDLEEQEASAVREEHAAHAAATTPGSPAAPAGGAGERLDQPFTLGEPLDDSAFLLDEADEAPEETPATAGARAPETPQFAGAPALRATQAEPLSPFGASRPAASQPDAAAGSPAAAADTAAARDARDSPTLAERAGAPLAGAALLGGLAEAERRVHEHAGHSAFAEPEAGREPAAAAAGSGADGQGLHSASVAGNGQPAAGGPAAAPALGDQDVDRIARRVVELIGDKVVRDIAWEVIPDLAEVVIKDRLRELESQIE